MTMKVSYYIEAPVRVVFDYFKDPASDDGLGYEVLESKMTGDGVGSYLSWRVRVAGIPVLRGMDVITDLVPDEHIIEKSSSAMVGTWEYTFEPEGSGTRITMVHSPRSFWALPPLVKLVDYGTTRLSRIYMDKVRPKIEADARKAKPATSKPRKPVAAR